MTYTDLQNQLSTLQTAQQAAQGAAQSATDAANDLQPLIDSVKAQLSAFHTYQASYDPSGSGISDVQWPSDASVNGTTATVIRDTPPDPVPCMASSYDTSALTWSDPAPSSIGWSDDGPLIS